MRRSGGRRARGQPKRRSQWGPRRASRAELLDLAAAAATGADWLFAVAEPVAGASAGWLDELLTVAAIDGVGAVGAVVVSAAGRIEDAGAAISRRADADRRPRRRARLRRPRAGQLDPDLRSRRVRLQRAAAVLGRRPCRPGRAGGGRLRRARGRRPLPAGPRARVARRGDAERPARAPGPGSAVLDRGAAALSATLVVAARPIPTTTPSSAASGPSCQSPLRPEPQRRRPAVAGDGRRRPSSGRARAARGAGG